MTFTAANTLSGYKTGTRRDKRELLTGLMVLAWYVESKDPYTGGHLWRVSQYSRVLARAGGLAEKDVAQISLAGFLHDLGKLVIPDKILKKSRGLSDSEFEIVKNHPKAGRDLIAFHPLAHLVQSGIELHHERPDGQGYPHGMRSLDIPTDAKIIGVCDAFDAMTSQRPYRSPLPADKAIEIIEKSKGEQFDADWVDQFIALHQQGLLDGILLHSDDGIPMHHCPVCGPVVTRRRDQKDGDHVYCQSCGREMKLVEKDGELVTRSTWKKGRGQDLVNVPDTDLIGRLAEQAIDAFPGEFFE